MVVVSEANDAQVFDASLIKNITGNDQCTARFLHGQDFTYNIAYSLWVYGNSKPKTRDNTGGFWRRVSCIPFSYVIPESERRDMDTVVREFIDGEGAGILRWALDGLQRYLSDHKMPDCAAVNAENEEYRAENDTFARFVLSVLRKVPTVRGSGVKNSEVFSAYTAWATRQHASMQYKSDFRFRERLESEGFTSDFDEHLKIWIWYGMEIDPERGEAEDGSGIQTVNPNHPPTGGTSNERVMQWYVDERERERV
jgi:putative DNA primase/helicase